MPPDLFERFLRWAFNRGRSHLVNVEEAVKLARRYFFINAFDGLMVTFGIVLGSYIARAPKASIVLWALLGSSLAMGLSGFFGAYISEVAERKSMLKEIEESIYVDVDGTSLEREFLHFPMVIAFIDAVAPLITSLTAIIPFTLASVNILDVAEASIMSISTALILFFIFGYYLGKVSEGNALKYALITFLVGLAISFITLFLVEL